MFNMYYGCYEFTLEDQVADLPPCVLTSGGQKWQFQVSIVTAHICRLTCRSTSPLMTSSGQE